jgi:molybdopterin/thiamine biosynthesis adenylyltransferase
MGGSLSDRSALVIGAGGLGGPATLALAAAGIGRLVLVDEDAVETSNLNRQPLFGEADLGKRKALTAAALLARIHPTVKVEPQDARFDPDNAAALVQGADVVVDASDNFATRFLANDTAIAARRPLVHGGVLRFSAQFLTVMPGKTGCLRCLFEAPPAEGTVPTCAQAGVLGALAGFAGALMGAEALRLLAGERGAYAGRLVAFDGRSGRTRLVPVRVRAGCPVCSAAAGATREGS